MRRTVKVAAVVLGLCLSLTGCYAADYPVSQDGISYGGLPRGSVDHVLVNTAYMVGYSEIRMNPLWVAYVVHAITNPVSHDRPSRFSIDYRTIAQVSHDDYTSSGYDRGHMAPNAAIDYCFGREAQIETFLMSNICPQSPTLNRGIWASLEEDVREWANACEELWVLAGPIFDDTQERLSSGVEIPDAFYKIIVDEVAGSPRTMAFVIPQDVSSGTKPEDWVVSVDTIESLTGFDFFSELPDALESSLEAQIVINLWSGSGGSGSAATVVAPSSLPSTPCNCGGPDLDCGDFGTHAEAQACYEHCLEGGYGDIFRLDGDKDGDACESLP